MGEVGRVILSRGWRSDKSLVFIGRGVKLVKSKAASRAFVYD
jgi:hypothetical protein